MLERTSNARHYKHFAQLLPDALRTQFTSKESEQQEVECDQPLSLVPRRFLLEKKVNPGYIYRSFAD